MAGVEIESERRPAAQGLQRPAGGGDVEGDLRGVDFEGEADAAFVENVQNRIPHRGEMAESLLDHLVRHGREAV